MSNEKNKAVEVVPQNELVEAIGNKFAEAIEKMGEQIRKPTAAEERKERQAEVLRQRAAKLRRDEAKLIQEEKEKVISLCRQRGHAVHDARTGTTHGFRGNLNSDGCVRAQCISCHLQMEPFKAPELIRAGSSVNEWLTKLPWLTEEKLRQWSKETNPEWWAKEEQKAAERKVFHDAFRAEVEQVGV